MTTQNPYQTEIRSRGIFIDSLCAEFTAKTGYGAYVYLSPATINQLYQNYLTGGQAMNRYIKNCVKHILA